MTVESACISYCSSKHNISTASYPGSNGRGKEIAWYTPFTHAFYYNTWIGKLHKHEVGEVVMMTEGFIQTFSQGGQNIVLETYRGCDCS